MIFSWVYPIEEVYSMSNEQYISFEEAEKRLGVTRATLRYYTKALGIERKKFPLDKRAHMKFADFERIRQAKEQAGRSMRTGDSEEDEPVFSVRAAS
jgi:hypothetical protein